MNDILDYMEQCTRLSYISHKRGAKAQVSRADLLTLL